MSKIQGKFHSNKFGLPVSCMRIRKSGVDCSEFALIVDNDPNWQTLAANTVLQRPHDRYKRHQP